MLSLSVNPVVCLSLEIFAEPQADLYFCFQVFSFIVLLSLIQSKGCTGSYLNIQRTILLGLNYNLTFQNKCY